MPAPQQNGAWTRGPWSIFDQHDATRINVRGPNEEFVADCTDGFYSDETDEWVMADESLPNAHLIAAAPCLAKAAESALIALEGIQRVLNENGFMVGDENPAIAPLRAALARARGEVR